jgi:hypothetical protein
MAEEKSKGMTTGYGQFYMHVFFNLKTDAAKRVYITLAQLRGLWSINLNDTQLGRLSGLSDTSVRKGVKELTKLKAISWTKGASLRAPKTYKLLDEALVKMMPDTWLSDWMRQQPAEPEQAVEGEDAAG